MALTMTLAQYQTETRFYLHDANAQYTSDADLTTAINKAVQQRDRDTGMNRTKFAFTLTGGTATYDVGSISSTATILSGTSRNAIDAFGVLLIYGNIRCQLAERTYTEINSIYNPYVGYTDIPVAYAKYGATGLQVGPVPSQNYDTEIDCVVVANPLSAATDLDPLPYPWTDPVPFKAAEFCKQQLGQYDEANQYRQQYTQRLTEVMAGARGRFLSDPYFTQRGARWP